MANQINLDELTGGGKIHNLSGHNRGLAARNLFRLDTYDASPSEDEVEVLIPNHIYSVSPSFVQGLFSRSVQKLGNSRTRFYSRYNIVASDLVKRQIERGMAAILTNRNLSAE